MSNTLLDRVEALVELERSLTTAIEKAEPWLTGGRRPLPTSIAEVDQVLCVARNLASRTSAPAGWNPQAPVMGFATPNPLPHQLRGGALGTLQLELVRKSQKSEQQEKKKRMQEEAEAAQAKRHKAQPTATKGPTTAAKQHRQRPRQKVIVANMNLSDDSSSEEEESDDE